MHEDKRRRLADITGSIFIIALMYGFLATLIAIKGYTTCWILDISIAECSPFSYVTDFFLEYRERAELCTEDNRRFAASASCIDTAVARFRVQPQEE